MKINILISKITLSLILASFWACNSTVEYTSAKMAIQDENWTEAEEDPGSNQSDSSALKSLMPWGSLDFRPGITPSESPPEVCNGVFDDRVITTGQPRLLPKYTLSDALAAALWPFWWVLALGFLVSWIFIYVIFGLTAVNPVSTIKAILMRVTTDRDKRSI